MDKATDIEGTILEVGDEVYYARKRNYVSNGELIKVKITEIKTPYYIKMGKYTSFSPKDQLIKVKI